MTKGAVLALVLANALLLTSPWVAVPWDLAVTSLAAILAVLFLLLFSVARYPRPK
jgi:hypothetical protein